jgi:hypothetical protein
VLAHKPRPNQPALAKIENKIKKVTMRFMKDALK